MSLRVPGGVPNGNTLLWNDEPLTEEMMPPERLARELSLAQYAINDGIRSYYQYMVRTHPGNTINPLVPVSVMALPVMNKVLTPHGESYNTSLHYSRDEVLPRYQEYFDVIEEASFVPFVRSSLLRSRNYTGTLLSLSNREPLE